jgi:hypothetical protein
VHASLAWRHQIAGAADPLSASIPGGLAASLAGTGPTDSLDAALDLTRALSPQANIVLSLAGSLSPQGASAAAQAGFSFRF